MQRRPRLACRRRAQRIGHAGHIAAQDGREIGIDDRGIAPPHQLDQRADLVADRDLRKAHAAHKCRQSRLMCRVFPRMHQDDGHRLDPIRLGCGQGRAQGCGIKRQFRRSIGAQAFLDLDHPLV